jgi:pimeloyl-ACP methyl ester carboxylesterase
MIERSMHLSLHGHSVYVKILSHASADPTESAPTLVFLHEALGSVAQWKHFPRAVCEATGCDGVVYDRVGHGQSSVMKHARSMDFYKDEAEVMLPALLEELGIHRPILLGHSDGATIALWHAAAFPTNPVAVISMAAHVLIEERTVQGIRDARILYDTTDLRSRLARYHGDKTDSVFSAWADTWLAPNSEEWHMLDLLPRITTPVLVVQGDEDNYGSRAQVDAIAGRVAGAQEVFWIEGCGHVPHLEARDVLIERIASFLRGLDLLPR